MTGLSVSARSTGYALEGVVFTKEGGGPPIDSYRTAGGPYTSIYNAVAKRLGTSNEATILRELHRQDDAQRAARQTPVQTAAELLAGARLGPTHVNPWDTAKLAAQIVQLRRDNPELAAQVQRHIETGLGNVGDQSRLAQDIAKATRHIADADLRLGTLGADAPAPTGPTISKTTLTARVNDLLAGATEQGTRNRGNPSGADRLNINELAYQVEQVATQNPRLAQIYRSELTTRLDAQSAAELNRLLAGDTGFGDGVALAPNHPVDAAIGGAKGIVNGGIALADMMARGEALRAAGDADQAAAIHSLFGNDKTATQMEQGADSLRQTAQQPIIPQIPYANIAQSGGGDIGTVVDIALAGKGLVSGGAKLLARNADEVAAPLVRQLDQFDAIAANARIDMPHILDGHLNAKGKAVGFHSRPDGIDPPNSKMVEQIGLKNPQDVYEGRVEIRDPATGNWVLKKTNDGKSTFYPDSMTPKEIEAAVRHAYADALRTGAVKTDGSFIGDSNLGFKIEGRIRDSQILTAYPIYK